MEVISLIFHGNIHVMKTHEKWRFHGNFILPTNYSMTQENFMVAVAMTCQIFIGSVHELSVFYRQCP